ncbi:hypothetical protein TVAGG3_0553080, partial [Trichomonas vaginalis G3]
RFLCSCWISNPCKWSYRIFSRQRKRRSIYNFKLTNYRTNKESRCFLKD